MRTLLLALGFMFPTFASADEIRTLRLDYYHTGNATQELFAVDRLVLEPLPWPGNPRQPIDSSNLGLYFFEVSDFATKAVLYSRGFSSIYGEWVTTAAARSATRTFHESLRFPLPAAPVRVVVKKRDARNEWREVWSTTVDPKDMFLDTSIPDRSGPLLEIENHGAPAGKLDLLLLGDGYTAAEQKKFETDARRLIGQLFATPPFRERRRDFNVWGLCPAARESGISRPSEGIHRANSLGSTFDAFGLERYILTFDNKTLRRVAAFAPYDFVVIVANNRTYGGGGIFGQYATVAADSFWAPYIFVHEFGHHFAGLADEYFTAPVAYLPPAQRVEPWEPNVTIQTERTRLKWKALVEADTPLPTPWDKPDYETRSREYQKRRAQLRKERRPEAEFDALSRELKQTDDRLMAAEKYVGKVGAFEGANYEATGCYRPEVNCIMFTRTDCFCAVCRRALERVIDQYTK
jgi:hypothetical protein